MGWTPAGNDAMPDLDSSLSEMSIELGKYQVCGLGVGESLSGWGATLSHVSFFAIVLVLT